MDQNQFQAALAKHNKRKARIAAAAAQAADPKPVPLPMAEQSEAPQAKGMLPFVAVPKVKKVEKPRVDLPRPKPMVFTVEGPVPMTFKLEWSGTLMGSQLTEPTLKELFKKCLHPMGRVS